MATVDPFAVPAGVAGYLEWCSGTLFINRTFEAWKAYQGRPQGAPLDSATQALLQTITHETYHFLQITVTGFAYQFACLLFGEIRKQINPPLDETRLRELRASPPEPSAGLRFLAGFLDEPDADGLSTRDILESAAFLYEYKTHYTGLSAQGYSSLLEANCPSPEYRKAYDLTVKVLGNRAFDEYLSLSVAALCFAEPNKVFVDILSAARNCRHVRAVEYIRSIASRVAARHQAIGSAAQVAFEGTSPLGKLQHPIYTPAVVALNNSSFDPFEVLTNPSYLGRGVAESLVRPILLKDGVLWLPSATMERLKSNHPLEDQMRATVIMGAIALGITSNRINVASYRKL
jgi:hypothetical protein